ncbi:MAG: methyltransferase domain-containing protein [Alphaproteobacteria bacterium]
MATAVRGLWSRKDNDVELVADDLEPVDDSAGEAPVAIEDPDETWLQGLWNPGFLTPGGKDYVLTQVRDLSLSPAVWLLELEPALGGSTRTIARETGAYVTAFESAPNLAKQGAELSEKAGLAKKAEIKPFDPHGPDFRKARYDHAYAKDGLIDLAEIDGVLKAVQKALKPKGRFILSQFLKVGDGPADTDLSILTKSRTAPAGLRTREQMAYSLGKAGFSIGSADVTNGAMQSEMVRAWSVIADFVKSNPIGDRQHAMIIAECERWVRINAALDAGTLEHVTYQANRT